MTDYRVDLPDILVGWFSEWAPPFVGLGAAGWLVWSAGEASWVAAIPSALLVWLAVCLAAFYALNITYPFPDALPHARGRLSQLLHAVLAVAVSILVSFGLTYLALIGWRDASPWVGALAAWAGLMLVAIVVHLRIDSHYR